MEGQYSDKVMEHFRNPRNVGEIEDASGIGNVGNPVCVTKGTLINCNSSVKPIEDISRDQRVLSHDGNFHRVSRIFKRAYKNPILNIDVKNLGDVSLTPQHHVLAMKISRFSHKFYAAKKCIPDWYMAAELKKGDMLLYPIPKEKKYIASIQLNQPIPRYDYKSKKLPGAIKITDHFLKLIGYYLSEGYVRTDKCKGTLGFVFGAGEENFVQEVETAVGSSFDIDLGNRREIRNSINIEFYSARLARFFADYFGKGAANKHLPHDFILLPPVKQRHLLAGLWLGDGCINDRSAKYVTISKQLAHQIRLLLLRQKIIFSFLTIAEKDMHKENYCLYVKEEASLKKLGEILGVEINRPAKLKNIHKCWYDDNFFYSTIGRITPSIYKGVVYNLEVEGSHSYVSDAATLHNCGDIMRLYIKVDDNEVITDAKFKTFGCGAAIATSSMVTELVKGKTVTEALKVSNHAVAEALGGLPKIKMHCSVLAEEALRSAIDDYIAKKKAKH